ncbi:MAG: FAD-dependent monooxygenase [Rhizobiaceae bacterium]|nr:FAD-dependent monooxygenase [Rhizobiaceae bacterium]
MSGFDELTYAGYRHYTLKKPFGERVVFIGDAYHSTSPQLGQGANMALLDAKALDFAIRQCADKVHEVGELYYSLRARQIILFQFLSRFLTPFYQSDSRVLGFIRDHVVSQLVKIPPAPRLMAAMVSGLMVEPFSRGLLGANPILQLDEPDWHKWNDQRLQ